MGREEAAVLTASRALNYITPVYAHHTYLYLARCCSCRFVDAQSAVSIALPV
jgi:hypothetical protein